MNRYDIEEQEWEDQQPLTGLQKVCLGVIAVVLVLAAYIEVVRP